MKTNRLLVALVNRRKGGVAMSATQQLQEEVDRLKEHLRQIQESTPEQCAADFRAYVSAEREPFHSSHEEANAWTMDKKGGGCCVVS